ncbi:MAG: hypothetical protein Tsb0021_02940 [Chlamydiales bacterium]
MFTPKTPKDNLINISLNVVCDIISIATTHQLGFIHQKGIAILSLISTTINGKMLFITAACSLNKKFKLIKP